MTEANPIPEGPCMACGKTANNVCKDWDGVHTFWCDEHFRPKNAMDPRWCGVAIHHLGAAVIGITKILKCRCKQDAEKKASLMETLESVIDMLTDTLGGGSNNEDDNHP